MTILEALYEYCHLLTSLFLCRQREQYKYLSHLVQPKHTRVAIRYLRMKYLLQEGYLSEYLVLQLGEKQ